MSLLVDAAVIGLFDAGPLVLAAMGFSLIYYLNGFINVAYAENVTLGAYFLYLLLDVTHDLWARGVWFSENDVLHIGLIVNPLAGLGGSLALKGSDGGGLRERVSGLTAEQRGRATQRVERALAPLAAAGADHVIMNPSRAGAKLVVLETLVASAARKNASSPPSIRILSTVPEKGAGTLLNIFMTSRIKSGWPFSKCSPSLTNVGMPGASCA